MLKNMNAATLHLLKKLIADACTDERREELGQSKGLFTVKETVTLNVEGEVKVDGSCADAIIAQKAKPWDLFAVALNEANKQLAAAGVAGIDLKRIVELAENADSDLVKKAKKETAKAIAEVKEEVRGFRWGRVLVKGSVEKEAGMRGAGATDLFALPPNLKGDADEDAG
jgi:hypothetical protein